MGSLIQLTNQWCGRGVTLGFFFVYFGVARGQARERPTPLFLAVIGFRAV